MAMCASGDLLSSFATGVAQFSVISCKSGPPAPLAMRFEFAPTIIALAVGHNEQSLSTMRRACFFRCKQPSRNAETQSSKVVFHGFITETEVPTDVLEKAPSQPCAELLDNPHDVGPQVPWIVSTPPLSRLGKRLTWVSGKERVDNTSPRCGVKGFEIVPDRRGVHVFVALSCDEYVSGVLLNFDVAGGGKARLGKAKTHVKSAAACTEGEAVSGRWHHIVTQTQAD